MLSDSPIVEIDGISKCYQIYDRPQDRLKQFLCRGRRKFFREFWALQPLSLTIRRGECVGFVGRNGSGKSTLLQILAGTLNPSSGAVRNHGRVAALLELGAGFNPEFSGRENVYLNAAILGLTGSEIAERFERIVEFSEIGMFIDEPVKTYSSGMYVRLAFSVAIHVDPEVLIVDEALSVGDAAFQYKCLRRIEELQKKGTSIILVSHDSAVIKRFCSRAGWLHESRMVSFGDSVEVVNQYEDFCRQQMRDVRETPAEVLAPEAAQMGNGRSEETPVARVVQTQLLDGHGAINHVFVLGAELQLQIEYEVEVAAPDGFVVGAALFRKDDLYICGVNTLLDKQEIPSQLGRHKVVLHYPTVSVLPGSYYFKVGLLDKTATVRWDFLHNAGEFTVVGPYIAEGVFLIDREWLVKK